VTGGDLELDDAAGERLRYVDRSLLNDVLAVPGAHPHLDHVAADAKLARRHANILDVAVVRLEPEVDLDVDALDLDWRVRVKHQRNQHAEAAHRAHHRARAVVRVEVIDELDR